MRYMADFTAHLAFMHDLNKELTGSGELVGAEGLAPPGEARLVRAGRNGAPAAPGPGGTPLIIPIEVRQVMTGPLPGL